MVHKNKKSPSAERLAIAYTPYQRPGGLYTDRPLRDGVLRKTPPRCIQARTASHLAVLATILCTSALLIGCADRARQTRDTETVHALRAENDIIWRVRTEPPSHLLVTRNGSPYRWLTAPVLDAESGFSLRLVVDKLNAETGRPVWSAEYELETAVRSLRIRELDGIAVISINDTIEARELASGDVRWSHQFASPSLIPTDVPNIFVSVASGVFARLQHRSGNIATQWTVPSAPLYAFQCGENICALSADSAAEAFGAPTVPLTTSEFMPDGTTETVTNLVRVQLENVEFHGRAMLSSNVNGTRLDWLETGEGRGERTDASYFRPFDLLDDETQVAVVAVTRKLGTSLELRVGPARAINEEAPFVVAPGARALADARRGDDGSLVALSTDNVLYRFDLERRALSGIVETEFSSSLSCTIVNAQRASTLVRCSDGSSTFLRSLRWRDLGATR